MANLVLHCGFISSRESIMDTSLLYFDSIDVHNIFWSDFSPAWSAKSIPSLGITCWNRVFQLLSTVILLFPTGANRRKWQVFRCHQSNGQRSPGFTSRERLLLSRLGLFYAIQPIDWKQNPLWTWNEFGKNINIFSQWTYYPRAFLASRRRDKIQGLARGRGH